MELEKKKGEMLQGRMLEKEKRIKQELSWAGGEENVYVKERERQEKRESFHD